MGKFSECGRRNLVTVTHDSRAQQFPGTATADYIKESIQDFTPCVLDGTAAWFGCRDQRLQIVPFGVGKVSIVAIAGFHPQFALKYSF